MMAQWGHRGLDTTNTKLYSECNTCYARLTCTCIGHVHSLRTGVKKKMRMCIPSISSRIKIWICDFFVWVCMCE